ncbi:MAG: hypothetical protein Sapg2KO_09450 [Saprospiraceae bacterium]
MLQSLRILSLLLLLPLLHACKTGSETGGTDTWLEGKSITLLQKAETARVYHIAPFKEEAQFVDEQFAGYPILQGPIELYNEELQQVKQLLSDTSSYVFSEELKMCLFTPNLGIEFSHKKGTSLEVLLSLDCNKTKIFRDGLEIFYGDIDPARAELLNLFYPIFKNEPYFQALSTSQF